MRGLVWFAGGFLLVAGVNGLEVVARWADAVPSAVAVGAGWLW